MVFHVDNVHFLGAQAGVALESLFAHLVGCHISVEGATDSAASSAAVLSIMAVHTAVFTVSALDLLVNEIFKILLSDLSLLKLCFISQYMLLGILIESHHQLVALVDLRLLIQLHPSDMMGVQHVLVEPADLVRAVLALDALGEDFHMPPNFSYKGISGALEH